MKMNALSLLTEKSRKFWSSNESLSSLGTW